MWATESPPPGARTKRTLPDSWISCRATPYSNEVEPTHQFVDLSEGDSVEKRLGVLYPLVQLVLGSFGHGEQGRVTQVDEMDTH